MHLRLSYMYSGEGQCIVTLRDASGMQWSAMDCKQEVEAWQRVGCLFMKSGILRDLHMTY